MTRATSNPPYAQRSAGQNDAAERLALLGRSNPRWDLSAARVLGVQEVVPDAFGSRAGRALLLLFDD